MKDVASAVESLRVELLHGKFSCRGKILLIRFLSNIKCTDSCSFVYRGAVRDKFFVLRSIVQVHVGPKQTVDQFFLLILTIYARQDGQYQHRRKGRCSHKRKVPESQRSCKENLLVSAFTRYERPPTRGCYLALRGFLLCSFASYEILAACLITFTRRSR